MVNNALGIGLFILAAGLLVIGQVSRSRRRRGPTAAVTKRLKVLPPPWPGFALVEGPDGLRYDIGQWKDGKWYATRNLGDSGQWGSTVAVADTEGDLYRQLDAYVAATLRRSPKEALTLFAEVGGVLGGVAAIVSLFLLR